LADNNDKYFQLISFFPCAFREVQEIMIQSKALAAETSQARTVYSFDNLIANILEKKHLKLETSYDLTVSPQQACALRVI